MAAPTYPDQFCKPSLKTPDEIKRACERLESDANHGYILKHNGRHIWVEIGEKKQQVWSPLLHLEVDSKSDATYVKGQYVENPALWVALVAMRVIVFAVFSLSLAGAVYHYYAKQDFGSELLAMFAMASLWFGIYLLGKWNRRLSTKQAAELKAFADNFVA